MNDTRASIRYMRYAVQAAFLLITLVAGWQFYRFVLHFEDPTQPFVQRPPSVDAYLPIGGLMAFKYFVMTGNIEPVHPSGVIMFIAICGVSLALKKGFCGWICPIGTASQYVWMAGEKIFGKNFRVERYTDIGLRSIKYALFTFFFYIIVFAMGTTMIVMFFMSDYYVIADVKMLKFFTDMSVLSMWVIGGLAVLSLLYKNFWCRYLCPYGALLGLLSRWSPVKVRRSESQCTHCGACTRSCPALIDVEKTEVVRSAECFGCMTCVSSCPSPGALDMTANTGKTIKVLKPAIYVALLVGLFYLVIGIGVVSGKWHSQIPVEQYERLIPKLRELTH
ncbi:MAG: 4Fe-4S binding protein [Nitrospirota bacterium]|nr:4Fe-4S binding protein [Nitrospirota bacterium]